MDKIKELEEILKSVGPQNIWHPVVVNGDKLLANGIAETADGIRNSYFYMVDFVRDRFNPSWEMHILSGPNDPEGTKQTLHFIKRK